VNVRGFLIAACLLLAPVGAAAADEGVGNAWLGVYLGEATDRGVEIIAVVAGGPAHSAGLHRGDVLTLLGDVAIGTAADVSRLLSDARPGTDVVASFLRGGKTESRTIELRSRPDVWREDALWQAAGRSAGGLLALSGITLAEIPDELRLHYGAPRGTGVLVTRVALGSVAAGAGLAVGDIVIRVGQTATRLPGDIATALAAVAVPGTDMEIEVVRGRKPVVLVLKLEPAPMPRSLRGLEQRDGAETSIRIKLLESELRRLEQRVREVREELERLEDRR
jgi:S1-C subfamily serine protease